MFIKENINKVLIQENVKTFEIGSTTSFRVTFFKKKSQLYGREYSKKTLL